MNKKLTIYEMTLCALFAALIAVGAFIRIPVPVVPFTLQYLFTMLAGLLLGPKLGALSVGIYLAVGLMGIPVFTQGGGPGYLLQPTFGYIIGFCVGAYVTGKLVGNKTKPSYKRLLGASLAGLGVVYLFGVVYYYILCNFIIGTPIGMVPLLISGVVLCLPGDILISVLGAGFAKRMVPFMKNQFLRRGGKTA